MNRKKIILSTRQIELLAENELAKMREEEAEDNLDSETGDSSEFPIGDEGGEEEDGGESEPKSSGLDHMIGDPTDRRIEYPDAGDIEAVKSGIDDDGEENDAIDPKDMKTPPHELLQYLDKIEEAKSILSKVAAKEDNENIKNRIYSHYEKAQKLAFELIKEFGIVH